MRGIDLDVADSELVVVVGPSGSGKTTLLRCVAGLEQLDSGRIEVGGRDVTALGPGERDVAMVFQEYALYPHLSVRENIAFGLRARKTADEETTRKVSDAAELLGIQTTLDRRPAELSGGERQRVALARAIVRAPTAFLLDEPLSNLDAALRLRTRVELAQLRRKVDAGVIMVTHDQAEAMTLADRIIVINDSRIQQVGSPMEIYARPANTFVARFVGSPPMTLAPVVLVEGRGSAATVVLGDGSKVKTAVPRARLPSDGLVLGLRPEHVRVSPKNAATTSGDVELVERLGERTIVYARLSDGQAITAEDVGNSRAAVGDNVGLTIDGDSVHLFGADGEGYHAKGRSR